MAQGARHTFKAAAWFAAVALCLCVAGCDEAEVDADADVTPGGVTDVSTDGGSADDSGPGPDGVDGDGLDGGDSDALPPDNRELVQELTGLSQDYVFKGVYVADDGRVVAVGNDGVIAERAADGGWKMVAEGETDLLNAVHGSSIGDLWAVGKDGIVLHGQAGGFGSTSGCVEDEDCDDGDPCTLEQCVDELCQVEPSGGVGCCGTRVADYGFDTGDLQGWTVSEIKGGMGWQTISQVSFGVPRYISPPYAMHFGDSSTNPPTFSNGQVVGAAVTSGPIVLPKTGTATLSFEVYMDTEMSSFYDQLTLEVIDGGVATQIWDKSKLLSIPTGVFVHQEVSLSLWSGESVQLRFRFDSIDSGGNFGEGVYIDDVFVDTSCGGSTAMDFPTLWGVHAQSPTSAFSVGFEGTILRWNGQTWRQMTGSDSVTNYSDIHGAGGTMVLVGDGGTIIMVTQQGQEDVQSPTGVSLHGVHSSDGDTWYAVGDAGTLIKGVGTSWSLQPVGTTANLNDVFVKAPNDVYVVGDTATALHYDGSTWSPISLPSSLQFTNFRGIWVTASGEITITGDEGIVLQGTLGAALTNVGSLAKGGGKLLSVWGDDPSGTLVLAGDSGAGGIGKVFMYGTAWTDESLPVTYHLKDVWGSSQFDIWVVGLAGALIHYDGFSWTAFPSPAPGDLYAVWGNASDDVWAAGTQGLLIHWDGTAWTTAASQTSEHLHAVSGPSPTDVFAVGKAGTVMHYRGFVWAASPINLDSEGVPVTQNLYGVGGVSGEDMWAAGADGQVIHFDGSSWTSAELELGITLRAVYAQASNDVWAVGNQGMVIHWNGQSWSIWPSGSIATLYGIHGNSQGDVYIVGDLGTVLKVVEKAPEDR